jgi:uncharacterized membrane protein YukC
MCTHTKLVGYIIYRFYTDFSLFRQIKRQDIVDKHCDRAIKTLNYTPIITHVTKVDNKTIPKTEMI